MSIDSIFEEIRRERRRQNEKWGEQNHPMLNVPFTVEGMRERAIVYKALNDSSDNNWFGILQEEVYEAFAETEPEKQREEMIQVGALAVQIIEYLDRRMSDAEKQAANTTP